MRRSATPHNPGVSLFPFLAVLICTMGVMMLLLVVCNRPGMDGPDDNGATEASAAAAEIDADAARGILSWRISQLQTARDKTVGDLADRRRRLSAVEEHMGKLRAEWNSLRLAAKDLKQVEQAKGEAVHLTEAQLVQLRQQLELTKGQVLQAAERRRGESPSFALVPYEGPNGTRRRPIYIECGPDRVTLQPEGIVLTIEDFEGPSGPGNPLATILRAMRDYLAAQGAAGGSQGEPYPLLIVRPDGIELFYGARAAMESWASEFGYELIEQDRKLVYPPPNPQLAHVEQTALADARARYAWFAQTRTGKKQAEPARPVYRASVTGGGIVQERGPDTGAGDEEVGGGGQGAGGRGKGFGGRGQGIGGIGPAPEGTVATPGGGGVGDRRFVGGGPVNGGSVWNGAASGTAGPGIGSGASGGSGNGPGLSNGGTGSYLAAGYPTGGNVAGAPGSIGGGNGIAAGAPNGAASGGTTTGGYPGGSAAVAGTPSGSVYSGGNGAGGSNGPAGGGPNAGGTNGAAGESGGAGGSPGNAAGSPNGAPGSPSGPDNMPSGLNLAMNGEPSKQRDDGSLTTFRKPPPPKPGPGEFVDSEHYTPPKPKPEETDPAKKPRSLADERGRNWSLPSAAKVSVPVSRPIHVECRGDRLIILPDAGNAEPQVVMIGRRTEDSVDKFVAGVWTHTKGWGIAGRQMYWRPSLVLELGPSGEGRFAELQALMANSGLEVVRK